MILAILFPLFLNMAVLTPEVVVAGGAEMALIGHIEKATTGK